MSKLGKNQLAILLIIDQLTVFGADGELKKFAVFMWEETHRYTDLTGERVEFFMMGRDLKSVESLVEKGLVDRPRGSRVENAYVITETGRILVEKLRAEAE